MSVGSRSECIVRRTVGEDNSDLTRLHLLAFAGYMNVRLGAGYVSKFLEWFHRHDEHIAMTAVLNGQIIGYVLGAADGYEPRMNRDLAPVVARCILRRPVVLAEADLRKVLRSRVRAVIGRPKTVRPVLRDEIELVGIGVAPEGRKRGIGQALMRSFEHEALKRGFAAMRLSVYASNVVARRFYEGQGWTTQHGVNEFGVLEYRKRLTVKHPD